MKNYQIDSDGKRYPKLLKTAKDKEQFLTWVAFLKAGVFKKAKGALEHNARYCCLGVGCLLTIPEKNLELEEIDSKSLHGALPNEQEFAPNWLRDINDDFDMRTGRNLSELNDGSFGCKMISHNKIADKLLKVYGHEL